VRENGFDAHVSEGELAGFLDGDLDPAVRRRVEEHLDACAACRGELIAVQRLAASYDAAGRPSRRVWAGLAAAAAIAAVLGGVVLWPRATPLIGLHPDTVRAPIQPVSGEGRPHIDVLAPASETVAVSALHFAWRPAAADAYRLTVLSDSGDPVWSVETTDTSAALSPGVRLRPGAYFWRVDAIAAGITATSGAQRLLITP
jgi:anti-sigma factor RsiW